MSIGRCAALFPVMWMLAACGSSGAVGTSPPEVPVAATKMAATPQDEPTQAPELAPTATEELPEPEATAESAWVRLTPGHYTDLMASGPWLIYLKEGRLKIANPDGSAEMEVDMPRLPLEIAEAADLSEALSPQADKVALIAGDPEDGDLTLWVVWLKTGEAKPVTGLVKDRFLEEVLEQPGRPAVAAMLDPHALRWSGDGRLLAFVAALDAPNSDVYLYDTWNGSVKRLTTGPRQAASPFWSRDGKWIYHLDVADPGVPEWEVHGVWRAPAGGGAPERAYEQGTFVGQEHFVGSPAADQIIVYHEEGDDSELRRVRLGANEAEVIFDGEVSSVAVDPRTGKVAFTTGWQDGNRLMLIGPKDENSALVERHPWGRVVWSEGEQLFSAFDISGSMQFSSDGEVEFVFEHAMREDLSPLGQWWAVKDAPGARQGFWIEDASYGSDFYYHNEQVHDPVLLWAPGDGGVTYLAEKGTLHYLDLPGDTPVRFDERLDGGRVGTGGWGSYVAGIALAIPPDAAGQEGAWKWNERFKVAEWRLGTGFDEQSQRLFEEKSRFAPDESVALFAWMAMGEAGQGRIEWLSPTGEVIASKEFDLPTGESPILADSVQAGGTLRWEEGKHTVRLLVEGEVAGEWDFEVEGGP